MFRLPLLLLLASAFSTSHACMICLPLPRTTAADRLIEAEFVVEAPTPELSISNANSAASGLTAAWARENTREGIFDAMERKEVYATTGTRLLFRVFAGWDFDASEVSQPDFAREGYARGVPMGGDLNTVPAGKAPSFMIRALRDPDGANLDRILVIKGWLDPSGKSQEKIYDVVVSDDRKIGGDGRCKTPVGNTVDVADATYTNTIGDAALAAYWEDPDFDATQPAFYYVRVIEIPPPRWTAYDVKRLGSGFPEGTKMIIQDRAYTSLLVHAIIDTHQSRPVAEVVKTFGHSRHSPKLLTSSATRKLS